MGSRGRPEAICPPQPARKQMEPHFQPFPKEVTFLSLRNDNSVKNHFFSRLRMSIRHLNRHISKQSFCRPAKMHVIYKIMSTCQERFNPNSEYLESFISFAYCNYFIIKNLKMTFFLFWAGKTKRIKHYKEMRIVYWKGYMISTKDIK